MVVATEVDLEPITHTVAPSVLQVFVAAVTLSFLWLPLIFAAYALGRRRFGLRFLLVFVAAEAIAFALAMYLRPDLFG